MSQLDLTPLATAVLDVPRNPERALVIGCGDGDAALFLAREFPAARVRGVDASEDAIRRAVARVGLDPEGRIAFKHGKLRSLPYPDGFFDLVAQTQGSLHAGEVVRVLRPGGHLIYVESPRWRLSRAGPERLSRGLERHGFEAVRVGSADGVTSYVGRLRGG